MNAEVASIDVIPEVVFKVTRVPNLEDGKGDFGRVDVRSRSHGFTFWFVVEQCRKFVSVDV